MPHENLPAGFDAELFDALRPGTSTSGGSTRRTALKAALGMTYAATAMPIVAQTAITTPDTGLSAGQGHYPVSAGGNTFDVPFYYAAPQGQKNLPVVLVVQEIFGLHAYIADTCRRFAQAGYLAIAPDLYARQGDASKYTDMGQLMAELVSKVPDAQVLADLDGALAWAAGHGGDTARAGITGFCWGGRITWLYAAHNPALKAGVAWYGRLVGTASALQPRHPVEVAGNLKAPVLGLYGGQDGGIPLSTVDQMKAALQVAGSAGNTAAAQSEFVVYPDAPHAFHADYRPSYRKEAAQDGFKRALAWFKAKGVV
jgi:carboxymethylenebutenolidase